MGNLLLFGGIILWIQNAITSIGLAIDSIVYWLVAESYRVFFFISQVQLFGTDQLSEIIHRIYVVLGVAMLFVFAYNILTLIANPDGLNGTDDKSLQGLAKNLVISIILITFLPTGFKYLQVLQVNILRSNVIGNIIMGGVSNTGNTLSSAGVNTATTVFSGFFYPVVDGKAKTLSECTEIQDESDLCKTYVDSKMAAEAQNRIDLFIDNDTLTQAVNKKTDGEYIEYKFFLSCIAGCITAYYFLSFAIDAGVRVAKLGFLQLIAPIPVVLRITQPKGGTFDRWVKEIVKTFLSLFIRLFVVYFSVFVITLIPDLIAGIFNNGSGNVGDPIVCILTTILLIFGVLQFAKDGPKMAEELFAMEHVDVNIKDKLNNNEYLKRGISMVGSGVGALTSNIYQNHKNGGKLGVGLLKGGAGLITGARNGWRNGNVSELNQVGGAINTSRTQSDATVNRLSQRTDKLVHEPLDMLKDDFSDASGRAKDWFTGEGITTPKLDAANHTKKIIDGMTGNFQGSYKQIDAAADQAAKDINNGKKIKLNRTWHGIAAGTEIDPTQITEKEIRDFYKEQKREVLHDKFNKAQYKKGLDNYSATLLKDLNNTIGVLGKDAENEIFGKLQAIDPNVTDMDSLKNMLKNVGTANFSDTNMKTFMELQDAIDEQVKIQNLQVQSEQAKKGDK